MDERVKWFVTGLVAACSVFLSCVLLTTAVLIFGDYENDTVRHDAVGLPSNGAGNAEPRNDSD